jgi:sodium transport system permease protein
MAGERERNTWETLMSSSVSRESIVTAKYLYVLTMGAFAGSLNVVAIALTTRPILDTVGSVGKGFDLAVPWSAFPTLALAAVLLAGIIAAAMMILAAFARTFAEGQAVIMPFYSILPLPLLFLQIPGLKFSVSLALIPIVNLTMMARSVLSGEYPPLPMAITAAESLFLIFLCLRLSCFILKFEDFISGSFSGGVFGFLKQRVFVRQSKTL